MTRTIITCDVCGAEYPPVKIGEDIKTRTWTQICFRIEDIRKSIVLKAMEVENSPGYCIREVCNLTCLMKKLREVRMMMGIDDNGKEKLAE